MSITKPNEAKTTRTVQIKNNEVVEFDDLTKDTKVAIEEFALPEYYQNKTYKINGKEVKANEEFTLTNEVTNFEIVNEKIANGNLELNAKKTYNGKIPNDEQFEFVIEDENKEEIQRVKNNKSGNVSFNLNFTEKDLKQKHKVYYMKEVEGKLVTIDYDKSVYKIEFDLEKTKDSDIIVKNLNITKDGKATPDILFENKDKPEYSLPRTGKISILVIMLTSVLTLALAKRQRELL